MQGFEVSENGCLTLSENSAIFCQTDSQTPFRHLSEKTNKSNALEVSDEVSDGVCHLSNCHCLSGGVSLGRAKPDTPETEVKNEAKGSSQ